MKWDLHYKEVRSKSPLVWPDINVVRLISKSLLTAHSKVLDLGCGEGRNTRAIHELGFKDIVAVDQSENALNIVNQLYNISKKQLYCADISRGLPMFKNTHFDLVVCWGLMHYLPKPEETLQEIHRVLSDNGTVILSFSSKDERRQTVDNISNYYDRAQIETLMDSNGFNIESIGKVTDQYFTDDKIESYFWLRAKKISR